MNIVGTRQGSLVGNLSDALSYSSFRPASLRSVLPLQLSDRDGALLSACARKLGEIEGMVRFVPRADVFLAMYVLKEALLSAQIEGTQCTCDDVFDPDSRAAAHGDVADVVNYVAAMNYAIERLQEFPLCTRLLREVHARLMQGVRGGDKTPSEIRTSQNWIGPAGCALREAAYVPPNVKDMKEALSDLDAFMNDVEELDPIVKAALVHYQFETIHPFLDGNGRLGRLLITLSLINDGVLRSAVFYPSYQLRMRRQEYYRRLMDVRESGAFEEWVVFFCECLLASSENAIASMEELIGVHRRAEKTIRERMGKGLANGLRLLDLIEAHPIVEVAFVMERLGLSRSTASSLVKAFCEMGILKLRGDGRQRYRVYLFEPYLTILRADADSL